MGSNKNRNKKEEKVKGTKVQISMKIDQGLKNSALSFVKDNKGLEVSDSKFYNSPRISSEYPDCSLPLTFDTYGKCSYGCLYCFAYYSKSNNPAQTTDVTGVNVERLKKIMTGEIKNPYFDHFFSKRFVFHWGGLSDPFDNFEMTSGRTYEIIDFLGKMNYPTLFSTKGGACILQPEYQKLFKKYAHQKNFGFQFSIITGEEDLAKAVEIGVPSPETRIKAMKSLSAMGYWTVLRYRPFIIGISDVNMLDFLDRCGGKDSINAISTEFYCLDERATQDVKDVRYTWMASVAGIENIQEYYKEISPNERGTYRRLNRDVKEPFIKTMYKWCLDNDVLFACSDPDFKELTMSPSCCGLPEDDQLGDLSNYSKNQQTQMIRTMRRLYWRDGDDRPYSYRDVYGDAIEGFLSDPKLVSDSPKEIGMSSGERKVTTLNTMGLDEWNNIASPANPYAYFHGKVVPVEERDEDGNMMYKYVPHEYEVEWQKEGIDLTKR